MNHDLDHCRGIGCNIRDHCLRYLAHLEAIQDEMEYVYYTNSKYENSHCDNFILNKQ